MSLKLSICTPTYNRAHCLREFLDSVVLAARGLEDQVELIVCDNGSADATAVVLEEYKKKYSWIKPFYQGTNKGFDRNLLTAVERAVGEYCWLISDDDAFYPDSFSTILHYFNERPSDYYLVNTQPYDSTLTRPSPHPMILRETDFPAESLQKFVESIDGIVNVVAYFGWMSGHIFRKKIWDDFSEKESFIGTQTIHMPILLVSMQNRSFLFVAKPLLKGRGENNRWDTYPGLETHWRRTTSTMNGYLWAAKLYHLPHSAWRVRAYFMGNMFWNLTYPLFWRVTRSIVKKNSPVDRLIKFLLGKKSSA